VWGYRLGDVPRLPRCQLDDGIFHATARANYGLALFVDDVDRLDFLQLLRSTVDFFDWRCHAHCLMGTHYHLVVEAARTQLSDGMRRLNGDYARRFNRRHGRRGHLFEERFSSFVLRDERHLDAAVAYVLQNPVRAGFCERASDWQWSAAAAFG
jgi:REP element-mobilizing transposase RayT